MVGAAAVRASIQGLFDGLVPTEVVEAYDQLLAVGGCAKDEAEAVLGDAELVPALTERGMAHVLPHSPTSPAWLRPASPDLAVQGVLAGHQHRLARDHELLLDGTRRLAHAYALAGPPSARALREEQLQAHGQADRPFTKSSIPDSPGRLTARATSQVSLVRVCR